MHGGCGDDVYLFLTSYKITGNEKCHTAVRKVYQWSEAQVLQKEGSWINEVNGRNGWQGISVFSVIALGEAFGIMAMRLQSGKIQHEECAFAGGDYILCCITCATGDISYPVSAAAALAVSYKLLK